MEQPVQLSVPVVSSEPGWLTLGPAALGGHQGTRTVMGGDGQCQPCVLLALGLEVPWEAAAALRDALLSFLPQGAGGYNGNGPEKLWLCLQSPRYHTAWTAQGFDWGRDGGAELSLRRGRWSLQVCLCHRIKTGTAVFRAWLSPSPPPSGEQQEVPPARGPRRFLTAQLLIPRRAAVVLCTAVDSSPGSLWAPVGATKASLSCLHPAPRRVGAPLAWLSP